MRKLVERRSGVYQAKPAGPVEERLGTEGAGPGGGGAAMRGGTQRTRPAVLTQPGLRL